MTRCALKMVLLAFALLLACAPELRAAEVAQSAEAKPDKKHKKKADPAADSPTFDEATAAYVLGTIRDGLESHSQRMMLSAFDQDKMDGYLTLQDQLDSLFARYDAFRVHIHILETSAENSRGAVLVDFQVESEPRGSGRITRREGQLRFELERGNKGWKIVDFSPRDFFS